MFFYLFCFQTCLPTRIASVRWRIIARLEPPPPPLIVPAFLQQQVSDGRVQHWEFLLAPRAAVEDAARPNGAAIWHRLDNLLSDRRAKYRSDTQLRLPSTFLLLSTHLAIHARLRFSQVCRVCFNHWLHSARGNCCQNRDQNRTRNFCCRLWA